MVVSSGNGNLSNGSIPGSASRLIATQSPNHTRCASSTGPRPAVEVIHSLRRSDRDRPCSADCSQILIARTFSSSVLEMDCGTC